MKFKELLDDVTWKQIEEALIRIYNVTPHNMEGYMSVVQKLSTMEPVDRKDQMRICICWVPPNEEKLIDEGYWDVHGKNGKLQKDTEDAKFFPNASEEFMNSEVTWAIEFHKWNELLGMEIDNETANNIELTKADIIANILWEMTFISYNEEEIQKESDEIKRRVDEIKNMSEEELKKNCCTMEEFKEKMKKIMEENQKDRDNEKEKD